MAPLTETLHATTVSLDGHGALILGASGTGKSALALQLIALGAVLVADDRTLLTSDAKTVTASEPDAIAGKIEARGVGILNVPYAHSAQVVLAVDMGQHSARRLPDPVSIEVLDILLPCLRRVDGPHFAAAILLSLRRSINLRS